MRCSTVQAERRRGTRLEPLDTTAAVDTPERVRFRYRVAGPGRRTLAWVVDSCVAFAIVAAAMIPVLVSSGVPALAGMATGLWMLVMFSVFWAYGVFFETVLAGRTPGKLLLSLRVVRQDGGPARFPDFVLRNLLRAADFLPVFYGLGVAVMLGDHRLRRIGDLVAGTVVVHEERGQMLADVVIDPPVTEAERQALPPRVDLTREEVQVIEAFLRRRRLLSPERAEELAVLFGPRLSERTGLTAPTWERVLVLAYARATGKDR